MSMKNSIVFILLILTLSYCKKENTTSLEPEYQSVIGTWNLKSVSYDSSSVRVTKTLPYNRLIIDNNLEYQINTNLIDPIENGSIKIISQSHTKLVLYFSARYSSSSSYAGSHIFGVTNVELVSLSSDEIVFKTINAGYGIYSDQEITFQK
jgi:hypothetical protein